MRNALKGIIVGVFLLALLGAIATRLGWIDSIATATARHRRVDVIENDRPARVCRTQSRRDRRLAHVNASRRSPRAARPPRRPSQLVVPARTGTGPRPRWRPDRGQLRPLRRHRRLRSVRVEPSPLAIGIGVLAGYLMLAVHLSFGLRKRIGTAMWRRIHYLSFVAFILVTIHAISVGTDRGTPWFASLYAGTSLIVSILLGVRIGASSSPTSRR